MFLLGLPKQTKEKLSKCWNWRQPSIEVQAFDFPESSHRGSLKAPVPGYKPCLQECHEERKYIFQNSAKTAGVKDQLALDCKLILTRKLLNCKDSVQKVKSTSSDSASDDKCQARTSPQERSASLLSTNRRSPREDSERILLPYVTGNLLCNWSAVGADKIEALIQALPAPPQVFVDLGCGDGRVVHQICRAFPDCRGVGIDLNPGLIEHARARATKFGLSLCDFIVQDIAEVDLSEAGAVFMYLPKPNLTYVTSKILPGANLQAGAGLYCAEDPLPSKGQHYVCVNRHTEGVRLFCYEWRGAAENGGNDGFQCTRKLRKTQVTQGSK
eukprot:gnl/MRDRNA2_/MRDRNA2_33113_c0_seq2.p1 gnl/MRDRNA2_/MRDRNA2_33113_c0~~gnl/MRDRNA2_/MRDRNA2_33113_c0_seq2.p1  ORF type:complete len:328 (+),score=63.37 gnl/MRDRNA2_/MRDRNA2_33113_c0_seq2:109-1092(+)